MNSAQNIDHIKLDRKFPSIEHLERAAKKRLPKFAFDYLQGGIGNETAISRNRAALDAICLEPHHLVDGFQPEISTNLFGRNWSAPFGTAPIGLSGLIWPDMASMFARTARDCNIPAILSTVATTSLEKIAEITNDDGQTNWFQLYVPNDDEITLSLINRAKSVGYQTLVVTTDVPSLGRRERDIANGLSVPPQISVSNIIQAASHPRWSLTTLAHGLPKFENLAQYVDDHRNMRSAASYVSSLARGHVSKQKLQKIRDLWDGNLVVKGILNKKDAIAVKNIGCDGVILSNHGGRQLDAAPAPVQQLPQIRNALGASFPIFIDSGARSGLDVARLLASGADFVFFGRAFAFGAAALGTTGPYHVEHILRSQLINVMSQLGTPTLKQLSKTPINSHR